MTALIGLDTNILVRYYISTDDADEATTAQCLAAKHLIDSGKPLFVAKTVVLEMEWVLRGFYKLSKKQVTDVLLHLQSLPQLTIEDRVAVELATAAIAQGFDFADALHHASSRHCSEVATFDAKGFANRAAKHQWKPKVKVLA
jgi:predicted nucleic-acid-binding protein